MNLTPAWETLQGIGRDAVAFLPHLAVALVVFAVFFAATSSGPPSARSATGIAGGATWAWSWDGWRKQA